MNTLALQAGLRSSVRQRVRAGFAIGLAPLAVAILAALVGLSNPARAAPPDAAAAEKQTQACEKAVSDNLRELRGSAAERIEFNPSQRAALPTQGEEIGIKGAGRYVRGKAEVPFTYRCTLNPETGETTGVVVSDKRPAPARPVASAPLQPDLTKLSPAACETAIAAELKDRYPRVGRIAFGSDSRRLQAVPGGRTRLEGRGGVERAVGMNAVPFKYHCEFDDRTGQLVEMQAEL